MQKAAVAASLMQRADMYTLDEPSAILDIEDTIALAEFLQRFIRAQGKFAIIIDQDIQLIDYVANSLIIFEGCSSL